MKNVVRIIDTDLRSNIYQTLLHKNSQEDFITIIISKPNEQYINHIVCTPTTNHTCL